MNWYFGAFWRGVRNAQPSRLCPFCRHKQFVAARRFPSEVRCENCGRVYVATRRGSAAAGAG